MSYPLRSHGLYSPRNSPGQNTGVGSLSLLQGIFPTQGSNQGLPHCRQILYQLSHQGSPRILEWIAYPYSSGSSRPRNQTRVSCIAGWFFTSWAIREAHRLFKVIALKVKKERNGGSPSIFNDGILYADQHCFCEFLSQILGPILRSSDFTSLNRAQEFVPSQAPGR